MFLSLCFPCFVVLAVAHFHGLPNIEQLWIAFGTGNGFRYIPIHEIASALCLQMAKGVLFFHAFTGCDVTPYFTNRGKKSAWKTWLAWPEITGSFCHIVIAMYCRTTGDMNDNTAWMILFSQMSRNIDNIPPTQAALDIETY